MSNSEIELCFDYLSCSFPAVCLEAVYKMLKDKPISLEYGFRGYKSSGMLVNSGRVAWSEGRDDAHLELPSQALHYYTNGELEKVLDFIKCLYALGGKLSRLDVAYDDKIGIVTMKQVETAVRNSDWVSRARKFRVMEAGEKDGDDIVLAGKTVYIGSMMSKINLRIYDKAKERKLEEQHWTRFEMMSRDEAANGAANTLIEAYGQGIEKFSATAMGLLRGYCDFRDSKSDTNITRRVLLTWWSDFVKSAEKLKIVRQKVDRSIEKIVGWIEHQVAPNLAVVKEFYGVGYPGLMHYMTIKGKERWRSAHETLLANSIKMSDNMS